jgi:tight adherence protein B
MAQLRDSIATGFSVQEGLVALARNGPEALRPEFATLAREMRLLGFAPALGAMRERLADPVFDVVAASLLLNDRLGGRNVSQVLDRLAHATRAQLLVQEELQAFQARNVLSARIVAAVPLVLLVVIRNLNPRYLALFDDWSGQLLLLGCLGSIAVGYLGMLWITRLPDEPRVLR